MVHYVYLIRNLVNKKIYIGKHTSKSLENDYYGSGKLINEAIRKYGKQNFTKEILYVASSADDALYAESIFVTKEFVEHDMTYNMTVGGHGSWYHVQSDKELQAKRLHSLKQYSSSYVGRLQRSISTKRVYENGRLKSFTMKGKHLSQSAKDSIGSKNSIHQSGKGNSQYGKQWIYSPITCESKLLCKKEADELLSSGLWIKGRKISPPGLPLRRDCLEGSNSKSAPSGANSYRMLYPNNRSSPVRSFPNPWACTSVG